jgi:hypothetical protein
MELTFNKHCDGFIRLSSGYIVYLYGEETQGAISAIHSAFNGQGFNCVQVLQNIQAMLEE